MTLTILDTVTGERRDVDEQASPDDLFWWEEGNGSCDCNRVIEFPAVAEAMADEQHRQHPDLPAHCGLCYGCQRFLIVAASDPRVDLRALNACYPQALVDLYLP